MLTKLSSAALGEDGSARICLVQGQDVANRPYKAPRGSFRAIQTRWCRSLNCVRWRDDSVRARESINKPLRSEIGANLALKRGPAIEAAVKRLRDGAASIKRRRERDFVQGFGRNGDHAGKLREIMEAPAQARARMRDLATCTIMGDRSKQGSTKKAYVFPARNTRTKKRNKNQGPSA